MKYKKSKYSAKRSHRNAGSQQKMKFHAKEVNNKRMNEEKFKNFGSENEEPEDQAEVESQFRHQREERLAKAFSKAQRARFIRRRRLNIRNWSIHQKGIPIRRQHHQNKQRRYLWPIEASLHRMLHEKRHLQRRIRRLKKRLHYLTWQMEGVKGHDRVNHSRASHFRRPYGKQRLRMRPC